MTLGVRSSLQGARKCCEKQSDAGMQGGHATPLCPPPAGPHGGSGGDEQLQGPPGLGEHPCALLRAEGALGVGGQVHGED